MKTSNETPLVPVRSRGDYIQSIREPVSVDNDSSLAADSSNLATATFGNINLAEKPATDKKTSSAQEATNEDQDQNSDVAVSDEECKSLRALTKDDLLSAVASLNEYVYKYNETAKEIPGSEEKGVDDKPHVGPIAQELAENPVTEGSVDVDPLSGFLTVDTKALTLAEMSVLSQMAKRILKLEEKVYGNNV